MSAFVALNAKPTYKSRGVIKLANNRREMTGNLSNDNNQSVGLYSDPLRSQIEILTSQSIAAAVVDSEPALLRLQASELRPGVLTGVSIVDEPARDSIRLAFTPQAVTATAGSITQTAAYGVPLTIRGVTFTVLSPPSVARAVLRVLSRDAAAGRLVTQIKAKPRAESDIIDVEYTGSDPVATRQVTNRLLSIFTATSAITARQRSRQRSDFIQAQLAKNDSLETAAQAALSDFRAREQMFNGKDKFIESQKEISALDLQRGALVSDREVARSLLSGITTSRGTDRARALRALVSTPGIAQNPVVSQLYEQLVRFRSTRDSMTTGRFSSAASNPDVQRLDALIASTEEQLSDAASSYISSLSAKIAVLDDARSRSAASLDRLPGAAAEELRLSSEVESLRKVGDQLREELQKANIAAAVEGGEVEIVDLASTAIPMIGSPIPKVFIGVLVGLVLGIGAALTREHLDTTIKRRMDIERVLQLASVGVIPSIDHKYIRRRAAERKPTVNGLGGTLSKRTGRDAKSKGRARMSRSEQKEAIRASLGVEAFASLRTHMLYLPDGQKLKSVIVTSCAPKDGKSTVSSNIAEAYARAGAKVLLIDADLRRPRLHEVFEEIVEVGLTDVLHSTVSLEAAMRPVAGSSSLSLLTAGSRVSNPSELIGSEAMQQFLDMVGARFDLIVIDSPPVLVVSDAAILSKRADGVLFVVRAGSTEPMAARAAVSELESVGANIIGVVLNDPDDTLTRYDGDHYYQYYDEYFAPATA